MPPSGKTALCEHVNVAHTCAHMASKSYLWAYRYSNPPRRSGFTFGKQPRLELIVFSFLKSENSRGATLVGRRSVGGLRWGSLFANGNSDHCRRLFVKATSRSSGDSRIQREKATLDVQALKPDNYDDSLAWLRGGAESGWGAESVGGSEEARKGKRKEPSVPMRGDEKKTEGGQTQKRREVSPTTLVLFGSDLLPQWSSTLEVWG